MGVCGERGKGGKRTSFASVGGWGWDGGRVGREGGGGLAVVVVGGWVGVKGGGRGWHQHDNDAR